MTFHPEATESLNWPQAVWCPRLDFDASKGTRHEPRRDMKQLKAEKGLHRVSVHVEQQAGVLVARRHYSVPLRVLREHGGHRSIDRCVCKMRRALWTTLGCEVCHVQVRRSAKNLVHGFDLVSVWRCTFVQKRSDLFFIESYTISTASARSKINIRGQ